MKPTQAQIEAAAKEIRAMIATIGNPTPENLAYAALTAAAEAEKKTDLEAKRLYRYLNGLDQDSHDKRAEHIMQQSLDGLNIGPSNRNSIKEVLANHFEAVEAATINRCAQIVKDAAGRLGCESYAQAVLLEIYAAIRALRDQL